MKSCGLIVEYNPFHYGHLHHLVSAKQKSGADCMIAVMSGPFLQRGEPAIIDKFHRTKAALASGADIVIELPYHFAVQNSSIFAKGAVRSLYHMGVQSICFGSESGKIEPFLTAHRSIQKHQQQYNVRIRHYLKKGDSFPSASSKAYKEVGLNEIDLAKPNNILGLSYVQAILHDQLPIEPLTIRRIQNDYHDETLTAPIASATSIRKSIFDKTDPMIMHETVPHTSLQELETYQQHTSTWHRWELYFSLLQYQVLTKKTSDLKMIHGVDEGLENRLMKTVHEAASFEHWLRLIKTKRYTQARLQRMFVHILTNTTKEDITAYLDLSDISYIRLLGLSKTGQTYLNKHKKQLSVPMYASLDRMNKQALMLDEKAANTYYAVLPVRTAKAMRQQEFQLPLMI